MKKRPRIAGPHLKQAPNFGAFFDTDPEFRDLFLSVGCLAYLVFNTQSAKVLASSGVTAFGGIIIGPHTPLPPF